MKKLGTVKNVIHDGTILLRIEDIPELEMPAQGTIVFDQRGVEVGKVARVFGPVASPYASLKKKPNTDALGLLGTSLYLDPEKRVQRPRQVDRKSFARRGGGGRPIGSSAKKGVKGYRRKEKPRKK